jgi:nicotinate (nicotinamide) nucleotide adenylyltransferase
VNPGRPGAYAKSELMGMEFLFRSMAPAERVAIFPGTWNPPTIAHTEIARAALGCADQVVWTIPRALPHKEWTGASFEQRCEMIRLVAGAETGFAAAISDDGLYIDMARNAREAYGPDVEISIVCGRDAAERIERWDYAQEGVFESLVREFRLLVAARAGAYATDFRHGGRIQALEMASSFDDVSSSEVRRRIAVGENWETLVPEVIREQVKAIYQRTVR